MKLKFFFALVLLLGSSYVANCQKKDSTKIFKNTLKYNISSPAIFGSQTFIAGYERVLNKNRTLNIHIGQTGFPGLSIPLSDSFSVNKTNSNSGFHFSAEYRFYLKKENKYNAPHGVYLAPYYSYNSFGRSNTWNVKTASYNGAVNTDIALKVNTIGVELGYQFIFWKRLTLDLVLAGPGIASYNLSANIGSNLSDADKQQLLQRINQALADKIPGYSLVLSDSDFKKKGVTTLNSFNFRYLIQVGFRF